MPSLKLFITLLSAIILLKTFISAHCPKESHHKNGEKSTINPPAVGTIHPPVQPPSQGYPSPPSDNQPKQPSPPSSAPSGPSPPGLSPSGPSPPSSAPSGPSPPGLSPSVPAPPSGQYPPGSNVTSNSLFLHFIQQKRLVYH